MLRGKRRYSLRPRAEEAIKSVPTASTTIGASRGLLTEIVFVNGPGLAEHALPFKYLGDGLVLRNHAIHALEESDIESDSEFRRALLTSWWLAGDSQASRPSPNSTTSYPMPLEAFEVSIPLRVGSSCFMAVR